MRDLIIHRTGVIGEDGKYKDIGYHVTAKGGAEIANTDLNGLIALLKVLHDDKVGEPPEAFPNVLTRQLGGKS